MTWAQVLVWVLGGYAALGVVFALWFVLRGVAQLDPVAQDATQGFRLLIFPGAVGLWPLLLMMTLSRGKAPRTPRNTNPSGARS